MFRSRRFALLLLPCGLLLSACGTRLDRPVVVKLQPGAALLSPCVDPALVPNPDTATDTDIALERVKVAEAYVNCRQKQADLAKWVLAQ